MKKTFLNSLILVSLLICSGAASSALNQGHAEKQPGPSSVQAAPFVFRSYPLTGSQGPRTAGVNSKQNRVKHPLIPTGIAPGKIGAPNIAWGRHVFAQNEDLFYLSPRFSQPIGRGPPASV